MCLVGMADPDRAVRAAAVPLHYPSFLCCAVVLGAPFFFFLFFFFLFPVFLLSMFFHSITGSHGFTHFGVIISRYLYALE
jgi:hypothetical protein